MEPTDTLRAELTRRIADRAARVAVVGLGYVGLPLAALFARKGFRVLGFDVDPAKTRAVNEGRAYIRHIPADDVQTITARGGHATHNPDELSGADAILICVPTPLTKQREPDMRFIEGTAETLAPRLRAGQLVVLESTTYPGTTRDVLAPRLEAGGLKAGVDFFLAYSPEREDPGNPTHATAGIPKVVGGLTPACLELARALYDAVVTATVPVTSPEAAEATKLLENIFRCVNIALVNELKQVFARMGLDVWEIIDAAKSKPFGFMPFYPGPGLGGHCIPIDPFYLSWKAREYDCATRFVELAGEINTAMPEYVVDRLAAALNDDAKPLRGSKMLILGVAYKKNVDDLRESPSLRLIELLRARGAVVAYHDPFVPALPATRKYNHELSSVPLDEAALRSADAVLVATDHDGVDYALVARAARLVVDTRNALAHAAPAEGGARVVKA